MQLIYNLVLEIDKHLLNFTWVVKSQITHITRALYEQNYQIEETLNHDINSIKAINNKHFGNLKKMRKFDISKREKCLTIKFTKYHSWISFAAWFKKGKI